ncbi:MAG TPA: ABC transporter substrate-binding protein [Burkholderiaceae bacterium]|nr:ABC transporter substrate-binding protein [Burkholderiaceae bacterium]
MKLRTMAVTIAASLTAATVPALHAQESISDGVVRIGVLTDLNGVNADLGKASVVAAQMAVDDFGNKVLGKPVELLTADSQNRPDASSLAVRQWFDQDKVDMITDLGLTHVALAAIDVAAARNKLAIAVSAAGTSITNEKCTPTSIHWLYDTYSVAVGTTKAMLKSGYKSWYFITVDYAFGKALEKDATDVIEANGGKVLGSVRHPLSSNDMASPVMSAISSKAQVIALANSNADTQNAIKQAVAFGATKDQRVAPFVMYLNTVHGLGLQEAQGLYLTEGFYWDMTAESRAWSKRFFERAKVMPNALAAGVYSSVLNYLKAVEKAGTDETDAVNRSLRSMSIDDPVIKGGKIRPDGRLVHDMYLFQVKTPEESKGAWDYYKLVDTIPGDEAFMPLSKSQCALVKSGG